MHCSRAFHCPDIIFPLARQQSCCSFLFLSRVYILELVRFFTPFVTIFRLSRVTDDLVREKGHRLCGSSLLWPRGLGWIFYVGMNVCNELRLVLQILIGKFVVLCIIEKVGSYEVQCKHLFYIAKIQYRCVYIRQNIPNKQSKVCTHPWKLEYINAVSTTHSYQYNSLNYPNLQQPLQPQSQPTPHNARKKLSIQSLYFRVNASIKKRSISVVWKRAAVAVGSFSRHFADTY